MCDINFNSSSLTRNKALSHVFVQFQYQGEDDNSQNSASRKALHLDSLMSLKKVNNVTYFSML